MNITILVSACAIVIASLVFLKKSLLEKFYRWIFFSKSAPIVTMGAGSIWFLCNVLQLSEADFGEYKFSFFIIFSILLLLMFFRLRDLLAIRGLAVLGLLSANLMLDKVYCQQINGKPLFLIFVYSIIVISMLLGAAPYWAEKFFKYLLSSYAIRIAFGLCLMLCGLLIGSLQFL